jgi:hypothetical protein
MKYPTADAESKGHEMPELVEALRVSPRSDAARGLRRSSASQRRRFAVKP